MYKIPHAFCKTSILDLPFSYLVKTLKMESSSKETFLLLVVAAGCIVALVASFMVRALNTTSSLRPRRSKWIFPPKEDKHARRYRWARVLQSGVLHAQAKLKKPIATVNPAELDTAQVITYFLSVERQQAHKRQSRMSQSAPSSPPGKATSRNDGSYSTTRDSLLPPLLPSLRTLASKKTYVSKNSFWPSPLKKTASSPLLLDTQPGSASSKSLPPSAIEVQRMQAKILRLLIEAGPAKGLVAICEESGEMHSEDEQACSPVPSSFHPWKDDETEAGYAPLAASARRSGRLSEGVSEEVRAARSQITGPEWEQKRRDGPEADSHLEMDLEPVMVIGTRGVSREMLWLALAFLGGPGYREGAEVAVRDQWRTEPAPIVECCV
eukprot:TRINITY_DN23306_c0_g1_i1.p1 TRINITY_DN23306_c0_g1~~TRINITY_DN23306_c0_g1_i1.p1  ORF type:complete len:381 (+),score=46.16 TRINITY_DN23306_c0_g1_i1:567-1709(+)